MIKNGCCQTCHGTLKLTISENEQIEQTDFLHPGAHPGKLKFISVGGRGQKWVELFSSLDPKICYLKNEFIN